MEVTDLIAALQAAKEGNEYLDSAIQRHLFALEKPIPRYSRSLDAAVSLLPEGWSIHHLGQLTDCQGGFSGWRCQLYRATDVMFSELARVSAATAPLAICLAAIPLRAAVAPETMEEAAITSPKSAPAAATKIGAAVRSRQLSFAVRDQDDLVPASANRSAQ